MAGVGGATSVGTGLRRALGAHALAAHFTVTALLTRKASHAAQFKRGPGTTRISLTAPLAGNLVARALAVHAHLPGLTLGQHTATALAVGSADVGADGIAFRALGTAESARHRGRHVADPSVTATGTRAGVTHAISLDARPPLPARRTVATPAVSIRAAGIRAVRVAAGADAAPGSAGHLGAGLAGPAFTATRARLRKTFTLASHADLLHATFILAATPASSRGGAVVRALGITGKAGFSARAAGEEGIHLTAIVDATPHPAGFRVTDTQAGGTTLTRFTFLGTGNRGGCGG